jgi:hypothetical protein
VAALTGAYVSGEREPLPTARELTLI